MRIYKPSQIPVHEQEGNTEQDERTLVPDLIIFDSQIEEEDEMQPVLFLDKGRSAKPDNNISIQGGKDYIKVDGKWQKKAEKLKPRAKKLVIPKV